MKKLVEKTVSVSSHFLICETLENCISELQKLQNKYGKDAYINVEAEFSKTIGVYIDYKVEETDEEYGQRLKSEEVEILKKQKLEELRILAYSLKNKLPPEDLQIVTKLQNIGFFPKNF
jgi:hypothetical protein